MEANWVSGGFMEQNYHPSPRLQAYGPSHGRRINIYFKSPSFLVPLSLLAVGPGNDSGAIGETLGLGER